MPFKKSDDPKTERIVIKVSPSEKAIVEAAAKSRHLTVAAFALRRMLGKQAPVQLDRDAIDLLAKLVMELRAAYRGDASETEGAAVLERWKDEAVIAIQALWKAPNARDFR